MSEKIDLGKKGEELAANYLRLQGYKILTNNFRSKLGEIDLVCLDPSTHSAGSGQAGSGSSAFSLRRKDFLFGRWLEHGETGNIKFIRLVRKDKGRWERRVHERLEIRQLADGTLGTLKEPLLHYPHQTVSEFLEKINFYTDLNAAILDSRLRGKTLTLLSRCARNDKWRGLSVLIYPLAKFIQNYFLKLGFLDGMAGFLQATLMSFHSFMTRGKLWEMEQRHCEESKTTKQSR